VSGEDGQSVIPQLVGVVITGAVGARVSTYTLLEASTYVHHPVVNVVEK